MPGSMQNMPNVAGKMPQASRMPITPASKPTMGNLNGGQFTPKSPIKKPGMRGTIGGVGGSMRGMGTRP